MFVFSAPNGKQLQPRISEFGNSGFKVDYVPVVAGEINTRTVSMISLVNDASTLCLLSFPANCRGYM